MAATAPPDVPVRSLRDILTALERHPEWRTALRQQLLGEELLELPAMFAKFAGETTRRLDLLTKDLAAFKSPTASRLAARRIGGGGGPPMGYEDLQEVGAIIVGSPDTVIRRLSDTIGQLNPGYMILIGSDGNIPHKDVMRSVELLGKEVVPALHEIQLAPYE